MVKRLLGVVLVVVCLCGSAALALDPMGPPTAELLKGQWSAGFEYAYGEMDLEVDNIVGPGLTGRGDLEDVETNKYYATVGYGVSDDWDIYTRFGAADMEFDADSGSNFDGDTDFAYAVGVKRTFAGEGKVRWGALLQVSWMQSSADLDTSTTFADGAFSCAAGSDMEVEIYEIQLAVGPTVKVGGGDSIYLYGGPFLHFLDGDIDVHCSSLGRYQVDLEEDVQFGGYLGALFDFDHNVSATIEGQFTHEAYLLAAGVKVEF